MKYDLIIRGGSVVDGSGKPAVRADVAVNGDRIAAIGLLADATAEREIDATGMVVMPGFIDAHIAAGIDDGPGPVVADGLVDGRCIGDIHLRPAHQTEREVAHRADARKRTAMGQSGLQRRGHVNVLQPCRCAGEGRLQSKAGPPPD